MSGFGGQPHSTHHFDWILGFCDRSINQQRTWLEHQAILHFIPILNISATHDLALKGFEHFICSSSFKNWY